jgi:predicted nucleotidyltransferase
MPDMLCTVDEISGKIASIAKSYGVRRLSLFGSYARGDATLKSDVDFRIVDRGSLRGLFRLVSLENALTRALGLPVDLMPTDALDEKFLEAIKNEEVIVYDEQQEG